MLGVAKRGAKSVACAFRWPVDSFWIPGFPLFGGVDIVGVTPIERVNVIVERLL